MLEDIYVPIFLFAFLAGILFIVIVQLLATSRAKILDMKILDILSTSSGILLTLATFGLAGATIILAINSKAQIDEARAEFETNQRPWVYADVGPPSGPLSFDQNGPTLELNVGFHNSGNMPAISIFPIGILIFDEPEDSFSPSALANTQRRRCTAIIGTSKGTGLALFPREHLSNGTWGFSAKRGEIERTKGEQKSTFEKLPYAMLCIDYQLTYTKVHHLTANVFFADQPDPDYVIFDKRR